MGLSDSRGAKEASLPGVWHLHQGPSGTRMDRRSRRLLARRFVSMVKAFVGIDENPINCIHTTRHDFNSIPRETTSPETHSMCLFHFHLALLSPYPHLTTQPPWKSYRMPSQE